MSLRCWCAAFALLVPAISLGHTCPNDGDCFTVLSGTYIRIPPVNISPYSLEFYTVTVRDDTGFPIQNAAVRLTIPRCFTGSYTTFGGAFCGSYACYTQYTVTEFTESDGKAYFDWADWRWPSGGCHDPIPCLNHCSSNGETSVCIKISYTNALGRKICYSKGGVAIVSPNLTDHNGVRLCASPSWSPAGSSVGLGDAVDLTGPFSTGEYEVCADFNGDLIVSVGDATYATPYIAESDECTLNDPGCGP